MDIKRDLNLDQPKGLLEITEKIIGCAYAVSNMLGCGFLEKVYENALAHELRLNGMKVEQQKPIKIYYKDMLVGEYVADLLVEDQILVELKAVQGLEDVHYAQCLNYLRATKLGVCLLLNFGKPKLQIRRVSARKEWADK